MLIACLDVEIINSTLIFVLPLPPTHYDLASKSRSSKVKVLESSMSRLVIQKSTVVPILNAVA